MTEQIIGAAIEVHRQLGPELLESTDRAAPVHEFNLRRILFQSEAPNDRRFGWPESLSP